MVPKIHLLLIDPQNDFCDIPGAALPVAGADADMKRLAAFIRRTQKKLHSVHVTLDSHNPIDVGHPGWHINSKGESPSPFTPMPASAYESGLWRARNPREQARTLAYLKEVETRGRHVPMVWPEHCLIGSWGHNIHADVQAELHNWARAKCDTVNHVTKGSNPRVEHYSAIQAEVPDVDDSTTTLNTDLIRALSEADVLVVAGEALSHCVAWTVRDIATNFGDENIKKLVLLTDCTSSVGGFEAMGKSFVDEMVARGMKTATSTSFLA